MNTREWTGIILAGGLSSRMGTNKAMLELNGSVVLQHVTNAMRPAVSRIIVAAGPNVTTYSTMGYDCVQDHYPGEGATRRSSRGAGSFRYRLESGMRLRYAAPAHVFL